MQDRYVPDLGDYSKFGVIDGLCRPGRSDRYRIALIWCLNEPATDKENNNKDGRHRDYLHLDGIKRDRFRDCAPGIYDTLKRIDQQGNHRVTVYRESGLFDDSVIYFEPKLGVASQSPQDRWAHRDGWLGKAQRFAAQTDVVLLDPDNGLSTSGYRPGSRSAAKYVTPEECALFYQRELRSLIVYQHAHRGEAFDAQIKSALSRLSEVLGVDRGDCFAMRFRRGTARAYLVVPAQPHAAELRRRAEQMLRGPWGSHGHFDMELY